MYEYLGIPYAEAPLKEYRWAAPRPPKNWTKTKETKEFGAARPQPEFNIPNFKREKRNGEMNKVFLVFECHWKCVKAVLKGDCFTSISSTSSAIQYNTIQYNTIQYNTMFFILRG